ncbi:MAG: zinc-ribbon domain [Pyrinomonadaceae bacterium]|jgi:hypothetical protein|nr:zinc-ribbon domain [Pyrinomonadaceae bacterium]
MYCPKCGTQNAEDASFCRGCGANVSLVPQALNGHLPEPVVEDTHGRRDRHGRDKHKRDGPPNLAYAIVKTFVGIAFLLVAFAVKDVIEIAGHIWWFWLLIPAAGSLGSGVAEFVRLYQHQTPRALPAANNAYAPPAVSQTPRAAELPPQRTLGADFYTPSSVTENTTKLLDKDQ